MPVIVGFARKLHRYPLNVTTSFPSHFHAPYFRFSLTIFHFQYSHFISWCNQYACSFPFPPLLAPDIVVTDLKISTFVNLLSVRHTISDFCFLYDVKSSIFMDRIPSTSVYSNLISFTRCFFLFLYARC